MVHPVALKFALVTLPPIFIGSQWLKSHKPHSIFYKKKPTKLSTGIKMDALHAPVPYVPVPSPLETDPLPLDEEEAKNNLQALAHPIFVVESFGIAPDEGIHNSNNNDNNNDSYNSKDEYVDDEYAEVEHEEEEQHEMPENENEEDPPSECSTVADALMQWVSVSDAPMEPAPIDDAAASDTSGFLFFFGFLISTCVWFFVQFVCKRLSKKHPAEFSSMIRKISSQLRRKGRRPYREDQINLNIDVRKYNQLTKDDLVLILRACFGITPTHVEKASKVELMNRLLTAYSNALNKMEMEELFCYVECQNLHPTEQMDKDHLIRLAVEAGF